MFIVIGEPVSDKAKLAVLAIIVKNGQLTLLATPKLIKTRQSRLRSAQ